MVPEHMAEAVRAGLADAAAVHEVRMFGGIAFMLNGNMLVGVSSRGLLARVGRDAQAEALARPGAELMEMRGRRMPGYVFVDPEALTEAVVAEWLTLARAFVETLPRKEKTSVKKGKKL
jgi:TfoX/Sxy family transcriptional regulator of competence genes